MFTTAKQALEALDAFFADYAASGSGEGKKLWDVLGAIRGPDTADSKTGSTAIIRGRAFPRAAAANRLHGDFSTGKLSSIDTGRLTNSHFANHIASAKAALLSMYPEAPPAPVAKPSGAGLYDAQAALVQLGKVQD